MIKCQDLFNGLKDKRVLITGATGGIGSSICEQFSAAQAQLGIHYHRNREQAVYLQDQAARQGAEARSYACDLHDFSAAEQMMADYISDFGGIDILINNAGFVYGSRNFLEIDMDDWDKTMELNVKAPFALARQAFAQMKKQGGGKIINISSISTHYGGSASTMHYAASKAALECMSLGLARQGAAEGILVNVIRAGFIDTPVHGKIDRSPDDILERIQKIPLKRAGQPEDIAYMTVYLASPAGDFITGQILTIAGGD